MKLLLTKRLGNVAHAVVVLAGLIALFTFFITYINLINREHIESFTSPIIKRSKFRKSPEALVLLHSISIVSNFSTHGDQRKPRTVVIAAALNYGIDEFKKFLLTLRLRANFRGDILLE